MDSCSGGTRPVRNRKLLTAQRLNHEQTNKVMCPTVLDCGQFFRVRERITCFGQGRRVRPTKKPALYAGNPRSVPMARPRSTQRRYNVFSLCSGVLQAPSVFRNMGAARRSGKCETAKPSGHRPPLQNCRVSAPALVRARKTKIQPRKLGLHDQPQGAVNCALYRLWAAASLQ